MCTLVRRRRVDAFELKVGIAMIGSCVFNGTLGLFAPKTQTSPNLPP